jgi:hypothetical protein
MTVLDHPTRARRLAPPAATTRQARVSLASDGVVAAYLHDISRHTAAPARRPGNRIPARPARRPAAA